MLLERIVVDCPEYRSTEDYAHDWRSDLDGHTVDLVNQSLDLPGVQHAGSKLGSGEIELHVDSACVEELVRQFEWRGLRVTRLEAVEPVGGEKMMTGVAEK